MTRRLEKCPLREIGSTHRRRRQEMFYTGFTSSARYEDFETAFLQEFSSEHNKTQLQAKLWGTHQDGESVVDLSEQKQLLAKYVAPHLN